MIKEQKIIAVPSDQLLPMQCCPHVPSKCCSKCGEEKPIEEYPIVYGRKRKDGTRKERVHSQCRKCRYNICKNWLDKNPGYSTEKKREWDEQNKEYRNEYTRNYRSQNADRVKQWKKDWDEKNYDWVLEYKKQRYPEIKDKVREWNKKTCIRMREELKDCYVIYTLSKRTGQTAEILRQYPELIEAQRLIIKTHRLCKTLQNSEKV